MPAIHGDPTVTIAQDMRNLPKTARKTARRKLRAAGQIVAEEAKRRASWSDRIPGTVRVSTSFRANREGVTVHAGGKGAPHARPYEGLSRDPFRHPVYGTETWVSQAARPFLLPAGRAKTGEATALMHQSLGETAAELGFS